MQGNTSAPISTNTFDEYNNLGANSPYITADSTGVYYVSGVNPRLISYYSFSNDKDVILCNKLNCNHSSKECIAYIPHNDASANSANSLRTEYLKLYSGKLYTIVSDDTGIFLDSIDIDGTNKIRIGNLYPNDITNV